MQPPFNSFPSQFPNQSNNSNPSFHPQGFPANPSLPDLCSLLQGSMPVQPQMGPFNPQIPLPFNNPSFPMPNMAALIAQQPALLNQIGMALQNQSNSLNPISMFMNQLNSCRPQGPPFPANFSNFPQQLNPNMGCADLQNLMYNLNSVMPTQFSNPSQFVGPQRPNFLPNPPFIAGGQEANANQKNLGEEKRINQMPQTHNSRNSSPFRNQDKPFNSGKNSSSTSNTKNFPRKDFRKNMKYQKSQFPHKNNGKRKFEISDERNGTDVGSGYERTANSGRSDSAEQAKERKRSFALTYTEQEIILWREERKKNYPSNANIKKKHSETKTNSEVINEEAKLRRERLKEILAKQTELGVEVAEIPSHYLLDSAEQVNAREDNRTTSFSRRERFGKKHEKRGRRNRRDRFAKRQKSANMDPSSKSSVNKREQTLLQKLLSADIKRDKQNLLQVFRFMVANKFFKDFPEKSLKFPQIVVKEEEEKNGAGSEKSRLSLKDFSEIGNNRTENADAKSQACHDEGRCNLEMNRIVEEQEEEGEIIN